MKQSKLILMAVLLVSAFVFQPNVASAVVAPATPVEVSTTAATPNLTKKQSRKIERLEKRLERMVSQKAASVDDISIDDPANKWLTRWLVCWGIGLILGILGAVTLGGLWYASYLFWTIGTVCAVIWLLKVLEAI